NSEKAPIFQERLVGFISLFFVGMVLVLIFDYFYRLSTQENGEMAKSFFFVSCEKPHMHFYFLGAMLITFFSSFPVLTWSTKVTAGIFLLVSAVLNAAVILLYVKSISYIPALLLLPLGAWQIYMGVKYVKS
ncbi:unknown, partial [Diachasmimorpha longicaudata entomopoxvirus]